MRLGDSPLGTSLTCVPAASQCRLVSFPSGGFWKLTSADLKSKEWPSPWVRDILGPWALAALVFVEMGLGLSGTAGLFPSDHPGSSSLKCTSSSEGFGHDTTPQSWKLKNKSQVSLDLLSVSLEYTWIYECLFTEIESWIFMDGKWGKLGFPQLIIHVVIRNTQPSSSRWGQEWPRVSPGSSSCRILKLPIQLIDSPERLQLGTLQWFNAP